jgi:hypothetical protein
MATRQENQRLSEIAIKPVFRVMDGVSIRLVESELRPSDAAVAHSFPGPQRTFSLWSRIRKGTPRQAALTTAPVCLPDSGANQRASSGAKCCMIAWANLRG